MTTFVLARCALSVLVNGWAWWDGRKRVSARHAPLGWRLSWAAKAFVAILRGRSVICGCEVKGAVNIVVEDGSGVWNNTLDPGVKFNGVPCEEFDIFAKDRP